jgi:hypothetical protein
MRQLRDDTHLMLDYEITCHRHRVSIYIVVFLQERSLAI